MLVEKPIISHSTCVVSRAITVSAQACVTFQLICILHDIAEKEVQTSLLKLANSGPNASVKYNAPVFLFSRPFRFKDKILM